MELEADAHHVADLMQVLVTKIQSIEKTMMALEARHLPATIPLGYVTLVDATGWEHKMLLDQCASFQQIRDMLPGLLHQCRPDEAEVQSVTQLTSDNDLRSRVQAGTKIVMRAVIDEVVSSFSAKRISTWLLHHLLSVQATISGPTYQKHKCEKTTQKREHDPTSMGRRRK
ncbi:hypothetical protein F5J12DRAFT_329978 [Pisolithus orientalis]|uniref:uncharacterized protein n=1 Tax=Pisolithus orientalis TaxID=936130 RepID=UPI00222466A8|nr:uncharacterized protein F5J12DRAFT_329978 [Pisolithus orientalis]KAI5997827.1 hypothetical protein F5J12DRAFT_329978 [Pisolithus orientalis]